jgi:hypothetical protein
MRDRARRAPSFWRLRAFDILAAMDGQAPAVAPSAVVAAPARPAAASRYLVSARYDLFFFILAPIVALVLTIALARFPAVLRNETLFGKGQTWAGMFIAVWTFAHLFAVVFRSHGNREIFARFRTRFTWIPLAIFAAMCASDWLMTSGIVLAMLWDIYHTSMQNFGFSRIYDAKAGNPPERGRTLDMLFNHVVYIGPIFVGPSLARNIGIINSYKDLGWEGPSRLFNYVGSVRAELASFVTFAGAAFLLFYVAAYVRLVRNGHRLPLPKLLLLGSTALVSIFAWGALPVFQAFFITNFFHALQYFAIVWATEKKTIQHLFAFGAEPRAAIGLLGFAVTIFAVGIANYAFGTSNRVALAAFTLVSLMHFWYDAFIWSVRRADVRVARS